MEGDRFLRKVASWESRVDLVKNPNFFNHLDKWLSNLLIHNDLRCNKKVGWIPSN